MDMGTRVTPDCHMPSVMLTLITEEKDCQAWWGKGFPELTGPLRFQ